MLKLWSDWFAWKQDHANSAKPRICALVPRPFKSPFLGWGLGMRLFPSLRVGLGLGMRLNNRQLWPYILHIIYIFQLVATLTQILKGGSISLYYPITSYYYNADMYIPQISKCLMHQNGMPEITWPSRHQLEHMVQGGSYFREESKSKLIQLNLADHWVTNCQGKGGELFNELFSTWLIAWFWWCLCCETFNFNMHVNFPEMKWKLTSYIAQHQWCYYCVFYLRIDLVVLFTGNRPCYKIISQSIYVHPTRQSTSSLVPSLFPC